MTTWTLPSQGPHSGHRYKVGTLSLPPMQWAKSSNGYITPTPIAGTNQCGHITPDFSGSADWGEMKMATFALPPWGRRSGDKWIWLHNSCLLMVTKAGRNQYSYITHAFSRPPKRGEVNTASKTITSRWEGDAYDHINPSFLGNTLAGRSKQVHNPFLLNTAKKRRRYQRGNTTLAFCVVDTH